MGVYTFQEFSQGMTKLGCSSIEDLKKLLPRLYREMKEPAKFKELYKYIFDFSRDQGYKNVATDTAIALWTMLLSDKCDFLDDWVAFLQTERKEMTVVQKDTWVMLLELIEHTQGSFANFQDDGAWPSIIDHFSEFYRNRHRQQ
jgi:DCN1-like protein 1/2